MPDTTIFVNDSISLHALGADTNGTIVKYLWSFNDTTLGNASAILMEISEEWETDKMYLNFKRTGFYFSVILQKIVALSFPGCVDIQRRYQLLVPFCAAFLSCADVGKYFCCI